MNETPTRDELEHMVESLYATQIEQRMTEDSYSEALEEFARENADVISQRTDVRERIAALEARIREATLAIYRETGDKHPHPAVAITEQKRLAYDPALALGWAISHTQALTLDIAIFEQLAKARVTDPDPLRRLPFVNYTIEPRPEISHDLRGKLRSLEEQLDASIQRQTSAALREMEDHP